MGGRHFLAKFSAILIVFLLVSDTNPAAYALSPHGYEKMIPSSVGIGGIVGWRKMNGGRVRVENEEGKLPIAGLSTSRSLRRSPRPPPPCPLRNPSPIPKKRPVKPVPPPPPPPPPPFQQ